MMARRWMVALGVALVLLAAIGPLASAAQQDDSLRVLVYSRTTGFRHLSIPDGIRAIQGLGDEHGFTVDASEDPAVFTDENLANYDVVIFLNTTGDPVEDAGQAAFERYVRGGGAWMGIHSAADTEYDWPFYGVLLGGAWFLAHPVQQQGIVVNEAPDQPATAHLPESWILVEEWYSFQRSPRDRVRVLLSIDESTYLQDPNTSCLTSLQQGELEFPCVTGVMGDHPMSWCVDVDAGRAFYTALGHESYLYALPDYLDHLWGGIQTAARVVDADCARPVTGEEPDPPATVRPDPGDVTSENLVLAETGGAAGLAGLGLMGLALVAARRGRRGQRGR